MRTIVTFFLSIFIFCTAYSQEDAAATKVLDLFALRAKEAPSVSMEFTIITFDAMENRRDTITGDLILSGNRYKLSLPESTTWFNGTDSWNHMPSVNEVTITTPEAGEVSFFSRPSLIYTIHRDGYKARMVEEKTAEYIIDLYPEDITTDMIRIRLSITKPALALKSAEYKTKNGVTMSMSVKNYTLKFKPEERYFIFDPAKYKGIEVIDMR
jgi:outer membrane lipoprotein carrier protein